MWSNGWLQPSFRNGPKGREDHPQRPRICDGISGSTRSIRRGSIGIISRMGDPAFGRGLFHVPVWGESPHPAPLTRCRS